MKDILQEYEGRLLILAADVDEAKKIAKAKNYTIDGEFKVLESKQVEAPAKKLEQGNESQHPRPSDNANYLVGDQPVLSSDDDDDGIEHKGHESPADAENPPVNEPAASSDQKITPNDPTQAPTQTTEGKAAPVTEKKKRRSREVQELTMDLVYSERCDTLETNKETWSFTQLRELKWSANDDRVKDMERIKDLVKDEAEDIKIMALFLVYKGWRERAYVTAKTGLYSTTINNGPTLDCAKLNPPVLLYTDGHITGGYRTIRTNTNIVEVNMAVTPEGSKPTGYTEYTLDKDAVEYVSSYYRTFGNKKSNELTQEQKYMVFLLVVKSGWGRYSRLHFVWHKVDSNVASLHMSDDDDDDMPNLLYSEGSGNVVLTSVNRKATAEKRHVKGAGASKAQNAQKSPSSPKTGG